MASTQLLSPRTFDVTPAASVDVSALDSLCSASLDMLLASASISDNPRPGTRSPAPHATGDDPSVVTKPSGADISPERAAKVAAARERVANTWQYKYSGSVGAASVLASLGAKQLTHGGPRGMAEVAEQMIKQHDLDDTFYVYDLGNTVRLWRAWRAALPRVQPFYAVKCNPEPAICRLLAAMGSGFDCASKAELEQVLALGVPASRIIFAHPCKRASDIRYAREHGIQYTTFDSESELTKLAAGYPSVGCVLRIRCDDPDAVVPLGLKYGAQPEEAARLLEAAAGLGLSVVGVSFHVGSGCKNLATFEMAIATARQVFDQAAAAGHANMHLLDIGGGFTGHFDAHGHVQFGDIARTINTALVAHFPSDCGVRVISEPGRYFAETSAALFTPVYGVRDRPPAQAAGGVHKDYWLTDGLYGSFNCILYDDQKPQPRVLRSPLLAPAAADGPTYESTLWGPTCDSADYVYKNIQLPALRNGDWLFFPNTGAYTVAGACDFNGIEFTTPSKFYVCSGCAVDGEAAA